MKRNKYTITREAYDAVATGYADNAFKKQWMRGYVEDFAQTLPKGGLVLDLGCGPGNDSLLLIENGLRVVGVDFSQEMIQEAQKRVSNGKFIHEDMRNINFPDNTFDGLWFIGSLHHLPKKEVPLLFTKLYKILKPGSKSFLSTQSGHGEKYRTHQQVGVGYLSKKFWAFWQPDELKEVLEDVGFRITKIDHVEPQRKKELKGKMKQEHWITIWFTK